MRFKGGIAGRSTQGIYFHCFRRLTANTKHSGAVNAKETCFLWIRIRLYKPLSLITIIFCLPPGVSILDAPLSSSSTWVRIAFAVSEYPRISATSLPTNHGSLLISSVRILPNMVKDFNPLKNERVTESWQVKFSAMYIPQLSKQRFISPVLHFIFQMWITLLNAKIPVQAKSRLVWGILIYYCRCDRHTSFLPFNCVLSARLIDKFRSKPPHRASLAEKQ